MTILILVPAILLQQAAAGAPPPESRPADAAAPVGGFFRGGGVDFWGEPKAAEKKHDPGATRESIWAEPIRLPDGRTTIYVPPPAVLGFLEAPTRETARAYLAWQEERARKLKAAMELLRDLKEERAKEARPAEGPKAEASPGSPPPPDAPPPAPATSPDAILYFKKPGCPWCARQDGVLADLVRTRPALKVRVVGPDEAPELWKEHEVTVVPTVVVTRPKGPRVKLEGFQPGPELLRKIDEVNHAGK